eukprot:2081428-Pyramimonas_sp.AAC.1
MAETYAFGGPRGVPGTPLAAGLTCRVLPEVPLAPRCPQDFPGDPHGLQSTPHEAQGGSGDSEKHSQAGRAPG